ncbi:hypothetical protein LCGC14_1062420 [marine sediment metagenome]|uniref:Uncharacterized protein n=1 Tax=marine sediment metagenome TaxID=412755 RepID=A0A0F9N7T2_9ZZZZ
MKSFNRNEWINYLRYTKVIEWGKIEEDRGWEAVCIVTLPTRLIFPNVELIEWLEETIGRSNVIWNYWLEFENEIDAMAFKLRWI